MNRFPSGRAIASRGGRSVALILGAFGVAALAGIVAVLLAERHGLDYWPIVGFFDEITRLPTVTDKVSFAASGNMVLALIIELIGPGLSSEAKTSVLYAVCAFFAVAAIIYTTKRRYGVPLLFANFLLLEVNQVRLALALAFLYLYLHHNRRRGAWRGDWLLALSALAHYAVIPVLLVLRLRPRKSLIPTVVVMFVGMFAVRGYFPRYFVGLTDDPVPINTFLHFSLSGLLYWWMYRRGEYVFDYVLCICLASFIYFLTRYGFSAVYVGRIGELAWHLGSFRFALMHAQLLDRLDSDESSAVRRYEEEFRYIGFAGMCCLLGVYRIILLNGNIWRIF